MHADWGYRASCCHPLFIGVRERHVLHDLHLRRHDRQLELLVEQELADAIELGGGGRAATAVLAGAHGQALEVLVRQSGLDVLDDLRVKSHGQPPGRMLGSGWACPPCRRMCLFAVYTWSCCWSAGVSLRSDVHARRRYAWMILFSSSARGL